MLQVTLYDPIWQLTARSSEVDFDEELLLGFNLFFTFSQIDSELSHDPLVQLASAIQ